MKLSHQPKKNLHNLEKIPGKGVHNPELLTPIQAITQQQFHLELLAKILQVLQVLDWMETRLQF